MIVRLLLVALVLASPSSARADADGARRMRKSGAGIMSVGVIHLGAGLALTFAMAGMAGSCRDQPFPCGEGAGFLTMPAISLVTIGAALTAAGMPLFFVGRARERAQPALMPTPIGQLTPVPPRPQ